jgi:phosphomannomutase
MSEIKFGTDGWRGVIAEDFTYANVRTVTHAIARYVVRAENAQQRGVLVGYDNRFGGTEFARVAAEVISSTGTPVWLANEPCPRPQFRC